MVVAVEYPNRALAQSIKTPRWAYVSISKRGSFDVDAAESASNEILLDVTYLLRYCLQMLLLRPMIRTGQRRR